MQVWRGLSRLAPEASRRARVATIGVFDGVHRGHAAVIGRAVSLAREQGREALVVTFDPHPVEVVSPGVVVPRLTTLDRRLELIGELGPAAALVLDFTPELAARPADAFAALLRDRLGVRQVVVGEDFRFGARATGDVALLRRLGLPTEALAPVGQEGRWSSTRARAALERGEVEDAAHVLGRPHRLEGVVERGEQRGRELGYPTANIAVVAGLLVPADGVYAGWLAAGEQRLPAAVSIGSNPTFGAERRTVEAHALDRDDLDLYGQEVALDVVARLRGMERFDSVEELVAAMTRDVAAARRLLG